MALAPPNTLFSEIIDFLTSLFTPEKRSAYKPSDRLEQQLSYLLELKLRDALSAKERTELVVFPLIPSRVLTSLAAVPASSYTFRLPSHTL